MTEVNESQVVPEDEVQAPEHKRQVLITEDVDGHIHIDTNPEINRLEIIKFLARTICGLAE